MLPTLSTISPLDGMRYGQPHDFNTPGKVCRCGLAKTWYDQSKPEHRRDCPVPAEPKIIYPAIAYPPEMI